MATGQLTLAIRAYRHTPFRSQAKREQLNWFQGRVPESQGHNPALTVLYVPYSLDSEASLLHGQGVFEPRYPRLSARALNPTGVPRS